MTHDEITSMAKEAGLFVPQQGIPENGALVRFAYLVAAAKREQLQRDRFAALIAKDDELLDDDGYPTEHALEIIQAWLWDDPTGWFEFISRLWHLRDWGWREEEAPHEFYPDKIVRLYRISTAGWSGNEALIGAMESNIILWSTTWVQSRRGGHYIFEVENNESGV